MVTKSKRSAYDKTKKGIKKSTKKYSSDKYQVSRESKDVKLPELKAFDLASSNRNFTAIAGPPGFTVLNAMVLGSDYFNRIGRKISMKSLHLRGAIYPLGVASANVSVLRTIVFYDSQPDAGAPLITDLIQDANAGGASSSLSEINLNNRERFLILRDKMWYMGPSAANQAGQTVLNDGQQCLVFNEFIKLKGLDAIYNGTNGGTAADLTSGALFIVCFTDNVGTTNSWALTFTSRLRYWDN